MLDNGDLPGFVELLGSGFAVEYLSRKNPFGDIKSDGTVPTALENLGLGEGSALPVGAPVPWPSETPPTGWLKCNGAVFSAEEYPELAKAYPTNKLPDLRGEFIRGWDDGRDVDSGRALLSEQLDAMQNVTGSMSDNTMGSASSASGVFRVDSGSGVKYAAPSTGNAFGYYGVTLDLSRSARTSAETRPRNIAFNYIVRAA